MTYYEVFQNATRRSMASLLTSLVCGVLGDVELEEAQKIYKRLYDFLGQEAK